MSRLILYSRNKADSGEPAFGLTGARVIFFQVSILSIARPDTGNTFFNAARISGSASSIIVLNLRADVAERDFSEFASLREFFLLSPFNIDSTMLSTGCVDST